MPSYRVIHEESEASSSMARGREALAMASLAQASHGSDVLSEHRPAGSTPAPSAPPLYPEIQEPSAPPLSADWQLVVSLFDHKVSFETCSKILASVWMFFGAKGKVNKEICEM